MSSLATLPPKMYRERHPCQHKPFLPAFISPFSCRVGAGEIEICPKCHTAFSKLYENPTYQNEILSQSDFKSGNPSSVDEIFFKPLVHLSGPRQPN